MDVGLNQKEKSEKKKKIQRGKQIVQLSASLQVRRGGACIILCKRWGKCIRDGQTTQEKASLGSGRLSGKGEKRETK